MWTIVKTLVISWKSEFIIITFRVLKLYFKQRLDTKLYIKTSHILIQRLNR